MYVYTLLLLGLCGSTLLQGLSAAEATVQDKVMQMVEAHPKATDKLKKLIKERLVQYCTNEVAVQATKVQNDAKMPLDEIKKLNDEWKKAEGQTPLIKEKNSNAAAQEVKKWMTENPVITECSVKDAQAATVGMIGLSGSFWHGDRDKFTDAFKNGEGGVYIGAPAVDKDTGLLVQKISLPLYGSDKKVIGVLFFSLLPDKI